MFRLWGDRHRGDHCDESLPKLMEYVVIVNLADGSCMVRFIMMSRRFLRSIILAKPDFIAPVTHVVRTRSAIRRHPEPPWSLRVRID